jgi:hypothetical protein
MSHQQTYLTNLLGHLDLLAVFIYMRGPGWFNELGSWITQQLIQAYHQYGVGSRPAL